MKLTEGRTGGGNVVRSYGAEGITIGETRHALPVLLTPSAVDEALVARSVEQLGPEDVERVLGHAPSIVLAGSLGGARFASAAVRRQFESRRIAFEVMDLGAACRTFNVLAQEDRAVLALLFG